MTDHRQLAQAALDSGAQVLVILVDGEHVTGHIAAMITRGFTLLVRHPTGRVERPIVWERIGSMAQADGPDEGQAPDDPLFALGLDLLRRAHEATKKSLAERILDERQQDPDDRPA